jgi:threonine dehydratase
VAEAAGAAASAAFLKSRERGGSNVALLVTGANLSRETLEQATAI